jgi:hypothetical protein
METKFKCAENEEHIKEVNITNEDVQGLVRVFDALGIPSPPNLVDMAKDSSSTHDAAHIMLGILIQAAENGDKAAAALFDFLECTFPNVLQQLKEKQAACLVEHKH